MDYHDKLILIAEDDESSYLLLKTLLTRIGIKTLLAKNGTEAVNMCKEISDIDLILMDISMPEKNGLEATKIIKQICPQIRIVAQTAYSVFGDRERALLEGCDDYITKPIEKDVLYSVISKYL
ncbi:MAG: response regulator [Bacteroidales bacterium]|jgi:CheY-like chemotaxis protein